MLTNATVSPVTVLYRLQTFLVHFQKANGDGQWIKVTILAYSNFFSFWKSALFDRCKPTLVSGFFFVGRLSAVETAFFLRVGRMQAEQWCGKYSA